MTEAEKLKRIQELEQLASKVRTLKRRVRPRRPIVIEFAGSPKAGKSSCISSLDIFLRRNDFNTIVLTERASVCPIPNKFDPVFNVWTGSAALNQLIDTLANAPKNLDVIIMDRGFFDAICWFVWQRDEGFLRSEDFARFVGFFTAPRFRMTVDLVLAFESKPETSIEREYRNLLTAKEGSIMRSSVLSSYLKAIKRTTEEYGKFFREIISYNTDAKGQDEVSYEVTKLTLEALKKIADEKVAHVDKEKIEKFSGTFQYSEISQSIKGAISFEDRKEIEQNSDVVQFIPAVVLKDKNSLRFLVGKKAKKAASNKSPERDKVLLYFGGHVREEDASMFEEPNFLDVLKQCTYREVREELGIDIDPGDKDPLCIWVRDGTKSEQHLAVLFILEQNLERLKIKTDQEEFVRYQKKAQIGTGTIMSANELRKENLDSWSEKILDLYEDAEQHEYELPFGH